MLLARVQRDVAAMVVYASKAAFPPGIWRTWKRTGRRRKRSHDAFRYCWNKNEVWGGGIGWARTVLNTGLGAPTGGQWAPTCISWPASPACPYRGPQSSGAGQAESQEGPRRGAILHPGDGVGRGGGCGACSGGGRLPGRWRLGWQQSRAQGWQAAQNHFRGGAFFGPRYLQRGVRCEVGWIWVIGVTVFGWVTRFWAYFVKFLGNNLCAILPCLVSRGKVW